MNISVLLDAMHCGGQITIVLDNGEEQGWRVANGAVQFCNGGGEWVAPSRFSALKNLVSITREWDDETHFIEWVLPTEDEFWYVPF